MKVFYSTLSDSLFFSVPFLKPFLSIENQVCPRPQCVERQSKQTILKSCWISRKIQGVLLDQTWQWRPQTCGDLEYEAVLSIKMAHIKSFAQPWTSSSKNMIIQQWFDYRNIILVHTYIIEVMKGNVLLHCWVRSFSGVFKSLNGHKWESKPPGICTKKMCSRERDMRGDLRTCPGSLLLFKPFGACRHAWRQVIPRGCTLYWHCAASSQHLLDAGRPCWLTPRR